MVRATRSVPIYFVSLTLLLCACTGGAPPRAAERVDPSVAPPCLEGEERSRLWGLPLPPGTLEIDSPGTSKGYERWDLLLPLSIRRSFGYFRRHLKAAGFEVSSTDFEGFEAEIYFRRPWSGAVTLLLSCVPGSSIAVFKRR